VFDVFSHFRVQYALIAAGLAIVTIAGHRGLLAASLAACATLNLAVMLPYFATSLHEPSETKVIVRAATMNVFHRNRRHDLAEEFARAVHADFLMAVEMTPAWQRALDSLQDIYPHVIAETRQTPHGLVLYSRHPCVRCDVLDLGGTGIATIVGDFEVNGTIVRVVGTHFRVPVTQREANRMRAHVAGIIAYLQQRPIPTILLGDLNTTPWSEYFRTLVGGTGLRDSSLGLGVHSTWPAWVPLPGVPIDHCLVSENISVLARRVGPWIGSDHRPVTVDLAISPTPQSGR
jgi:endonuclease/exonuclease/phosphatase (EEP) superfamily protein YafD